MLLSRILNLTGRHSISEVEAFIKQSRVSINGSPVCTDVLVQDWSQPIELDGRRTELWRPALWMYNKPLGRECGFAGSDQRLHSSVQIQRRGTVLQLFSAKFPSMPSLLAVDDMHDDTEGLLLVTSSDKILQLLTNPTLNIPKSTQRTYRVQARGQVNLAALSNLSRGVQIHGVPYGYIKALILKTSEEFIWMDITLDETPPRSVRRLLSHHLNVELVRLQRTEIGPFHLPKDLPVDKYREVNLRQLPLATVFTLPELKFFQLPKNFTRKSSRNETPDGRDDQIQFDLFEDGKVNKRSKSDPAALSKLGLDSKAKFAPTSKDNLSKIPIESNSERAKVEERKNLRELKKARLEAIKAAKAEPKRHSAFIQAPSRKGPSDTPHQSSNAANIGEDDIGDDLPAEMREKNIEKLKKMFSRLDQSTSQVETSVKRANPVKETRAGLKNIGSGLVSRPTNRPNSKSHQETENFRTPSLVKKSRSENGNQPPRAAPSVVKSDRIGPSYYHFND